MVPLILLAAAIAPQSELLIICNGSMVANVGNSTTTAVVTDSSGASATGRSVTSHPGQVNVTVQFRLINGKAQLHLPPYALPSLNSAKEGWLQVKDLSVTEDQISGKVRFNFLNFLNSHFFH